MSSRKRHERTRDSLLAVGPNGVRRRIVSTLTEPLDRSLTQVASESQPARCRARATMPRCGCTIVLPCTGFPHTVTQLFDFLFAPRVSPVSLSALASPVWSGLSLSLGPPEARLVLVLTRLVAGRETDGETMNFFSNRATLASTRVHHRPLAPSAASCRPPLVWASPSIDADRLASSQWSPPPSAAPFLAFAGATRFRLGNGDAASRHPCRRRRPCTDGGCVAAVGRFRPPPPRRRLARWSCRWRVSSLHSSSARPPVLGW